MRAKESKNHPYKQKVFRVGTDNRLYSVRDVQRAIATGAIQPGTEVTDIDGGIFFAKDVADFKSPSWAQTMSTDPLLGNVPRPEVSIEIGEGDLEMPLSDTGLSEKSKTRQTKSVRNASEGTMLGRSATTGNFSVGCVVPKGSPLASHSPERVAKAVELAVRRSADPDFESDAFVSGISPSDVDDAVLSVLRKRDPAAAKRDAALDRTVSEIQAAVLHEIFGTPDNQTDKPAGNQTGNQRTPIKPMTPMSVFGSNKDIPEITSESLDAFGKTLAAREQQIREGTGFGTPNFGDVHYGDSAFSEILGQ